MITISDVKKQQKEIALEMGFSLKEAIEYAEDYIIMKGEEYAIENYYNYHSKDNDN